MEKPKRKPEHTLMDAIGFTDEDLEANRAGWITEEQRRRLNREYNKRVFFLLPGIMLFVFITGVFLVAGMLSGQLAIGGMLFVLLVGGAVYLYRWREHMMIDRRRGDVQGLEGRIELDTVSMNNAQQFTVSVQDQKFKVKKAVFLAFKNGDPYVIYYLPRSKTILAAEWLRED